MDQEQARKIIADWGKLKYGNLLEVRDVKPIRRATGRVWGGNLHCTTKEGDLLAGKTVVNEKGKIIEEMTIDKLVDALVLWRTKNTQMQSAETEASEDDFGDLADDMDFSSLADEGEDFSDITGGDDSNDAGSGVDPDVLQEKANQLITTGEQDKLMEARNILPMLLAYQDRRGQVLQQMAELELLLGELEMGARHLEASAREYADLANIDGLEEVAQLAAQLMTEEQFEASPIRALYNQTANKLYPLENLTDAPLFVGIGDEEMFAIEGVANPVLIERGEVLLREGDVANMAFIIKSGTLSIRLESADGSSKVVRSCFPGDFIGETSVIGEPGATCTATVQGECSTELWQFDGQQLRELSQEYQEIRFRVESAKTLHQLDSFISMNESTATLDVSMRDHLLSCITGIRQAKADTVLNPSGNVPESVHLIVNGKIFYRIKGEIIREYNADAFAGLRDTLHELPLEGEFVAGTDCLLVFLDPQRLKEIAQGATPEVVAVLEKLE